MRGEGREEKSGRGGLSGNVAEEAFCLKSSPICRSAQPTASKHWTRVLVAEEYCNICFTAIYFSTYRAGLGSGRQLGGGYIANLHGLKKYVDAYGRERSLLISQLSRYTNVTDRQVDTGRQL